MPENKPIVSFVLPGIVETNGTLTGLEAVSVSLEKILGSISKI